MWEVQSGGKEIELSKDHYTKRLERERVNFGENRPLKSMFIGGYGSKIIPFVNGALSKKKIYEQKISPRNIMCT
jgi:hypothetical protein